MKALITEFSNNTSHFTRTLLYSFIQTNKWFDGEVFLLTHPDLKISSQNLSLLENIYPKINLLPAAKPAQMNLFFNTNKSYFSKISNIQDYLKYSIFTYNLNEVLYVNNQSIFNLDISLNIKNSETLISPSFNIFYLKNKESINIDFIQDYKILNQKSLNDEFIKNNESLTFNSPLTYLDSSLVIDKYYHKYQNNFKNYPLFTYSIENTTNQKFHKIWLQKNKEAIQFSNKPASSNPQNIKSNVKPDQTKLTQHKKKLKTINGIYTKKIKKDESRFKISIIIPAYKVDKYIEECLNGIYSQKTQATFEVLIGIDNCITTENKLKLISKKYKNLKIFKSNQNVGPYIIRNSLIDHSQYDNLLFFDADDVPMPHLISNILSHYSINNPIRFRYYNFRGSNPNSNKRLHKSAAQGVFFISKELINKIGGFQPWKMGADTDFMRRCMQNNIKDIIINEPLFYRRLHPTSLTQDPKTNHKSEGRKRIIQYLSRNKNWQIPINKTITKLAKI